MGQFCLPRGARTPGAGLADRDGPRLCLSHGAGRRNGTPTPNRRAAWIGSTPKSACKWTARNQPAADPPASLRATAKTFSARPFSPNWMTRASPGSALPDGRRLPFPVPRLKLMLGVLMDLFEPQRWTTTGACAWTRCARGGVVRHAGAAAFRWMGGDTLRTLNGKLRDFRAILPVPPPGKDCKPACAATSRRGSIGCNSCASYNLAGILADDMGLGKTVQALAHLLEEKNSGRADRPSSTGQEARNG